MKIEQYSPALWVIKNRFINERGVPLTFNNHFFLYDIYNDLSSHMVCKKCSQIGFSVMANIKAINLAKFRNITSIYTMPSDDDVREFVKTKTDKIIMSNAVLRNLITPDNDSVHLKQIGNNFIYFKGTRSKSAPISTTADLLIHDEIDRSDLGIVEQYRSRITASKFKGRWIFSNPSVVNAGVDIDWKYSDQKEWFIKCNKCGSEQELTWEDNVDEINGEYVCKFCNKILTTKERKLGHWVAKKPENEVSGYHISQMMAPWMSAQELIDIKEKQGIQYFYNFILGEPYSAGEVADLRQVIYDCWTVNPLDKEPFFMGVDIGREKHYVLGSQAGIFKIGKVQSRQELESIIERYNPTMVMDAGPERTWAEELKDKYPKMHLCFYRVDKSRQEMVKWGGDRGTEEDLKDVGLVWVDRTRIIDTVIREFLLGKILVHLTREDLERYIAHWQTMRRMIEDTTLGTKRYKWESATGVDHWCHATVYYYLAKMRGSGAVEFVPDKGGKSQEVIIQEDGEFKMRSLKELIEEQNE